MGHAPGHLREAFQAIVGEDDEWYDNVFDDEALPKNHLLGKLDSCSDIMPKDICEQLELPAGSTYAMGVGAYICTNGLPEE